MTDSLMETVARALFDPEWRGLRPDIRPTFGRDESDRQYWIDSARAALLAIKSRAAENGNFVLLGDGWVICRNKEPDPITDTERAEIERRAFLHAVGVVEASGTHLVMPAFDSTGRLIIRDPSTFGDVEAALDRADVPCRDESGKWLTLVERVALLSSRPRVT
jgi:hypothetical protein